MEKLKLKPLEFEYIQYEDTLENLHAIKRFCKDQVTITLETCSIDDYWDVRLYDSYKDKFITLAISNYILKIDDNCFTVIDKKDISKFFQKTSE
ncbi:MAG: hypothetical protein [Wendovervirus sonii]|uniref:Uncharacterized protein n=1 Tax=phage Lak_Megaphage_Sonny TaxID=3109229 RepID=A0ABZ0Z3Q0_9CAUD|nr:MAG: hypothetical protein [phage Lak_Megaphage_Sonny]